MKVATVAGPDLQTVNGIPPLACPAKPEVIGFKKHFGVQPGFACECTWILHELGRSFFGYRTELIAEAAVDANAAERSGLHISIIINVLVMLLVLRLLPLR